ncbi:MAG: acetyl-CoA carboxylase biotin carboxylase subunit [SAR202 cluster bacterium]|nr:acetyl-CoA carboxylase biotin carboxylase subunit [SAR202 cluster bacterium]
MFKKVLIANRGEIACRVIRACHKVGIQAAVVYSDADADALHVRMADEAVRIGPPPARESYLRIPNIIKAAKKIKADAIHPGYGFLSEKPEFVKAAEDAGLAFIGPSAKAMEQMGDKVMARKLAKAAGVPVIPGTEGTVSDRAAAKAAKGIGFPLMVKAADGGGGMGIRVVERPEDLATALERARAQAAGAFDSSRVYLEKRIVKASHIEVQVMGDLHGGALHFYERDCSVQRRNQKVIEETPSAKLTPETRQALVESAVRLVKKIGYYNAGTIEYLFDGDSGQFYFLEMNTRIQVEHPITEVATGVDLVELQLLVAAGEHLPIAQDDIHHSGAAIEARIYPEDPSTLLPTSGTVEHLALPDGDGVRVDTALYEGYSVSPYYEPMMAKVIARGDDRDAAIANLQKALDRFKTGGVINNIPLIKRVLNHPTFKSGAYTTGFLEGYLKEPHQAMGNELVAAIALAIAQAREKSEGGQPNKWRIFGRRAQVVGRLGSGVA